jgi:hypothetical protein
MASEYTEDKRPHYRIKVKGVLDTKWADWFNGLTIQPGNADETLLYGPVRDQAALHGMLAKIRDLGLTLLTVQICRDTEELK